VSLWKKVDRALSGYERLAKLIGATILIVGAITVAVVFLKDRQVGAWVPVVVGIALSALILGAYVLGQRGRADDSDLAPAEYEKRLVYDALESIQQAFATDEDWELDQLVERGVLGPARGFLLREREEDVRLAVLQPQDDAPDRFWMRWAAGHRPESVRNYDREIDATLAGLAYRRDEFIDLGNVREDPRFEPNPRETRPFLSLFAMPLRLDVEVVGVLSVVSTRENAFTPTDVSFIKVIGALLDVLLASEHDINRWEEEAEAMGRHPRRSIAPRNEQA
jgi:GAF domain-containing protein